MMDALLSAWPYLLHLLIYAGIYAILGMSLNLITGYTGLLNLGHAGFWAVGAYTSVLLVMAGVPWPLALVASAVLAGLSGVLIGFPSLRLRGDYFAIATLGFGEIIRSVLINWGEVTRGPLGIPGIPRPEFFGFALDANEAYLVLVVLLAAFTYVFLRRLTRSGFGRVLKAIREDEIAAQALGKDVNKYKLTAMGIGAGFAGIAGSLFAHYITFIDPSSFVLNESVLMLLMVVLGGLGSLEGSILGAVVLTLLPEPLRLIGANTDITLLKTGFAQVRLIVYAAVLILVMLKMPQGLIGEGQSHFFPRLFSEGKKAERRERK